MPHPEAIAYLPESTQMYIRKIYNRIESGKNCLVAVVGQTGAGKSYATLSLLIALDLYRYGEAKEPQWYIDHCVFRALDLMKGLNDEKLQLKTNWLWDESGVDAGTGEHATVKNRVIGWLAQTFRNMQQVVFFTLPALGMLTPQVRKLLHFYLEAIYIDPKLSICVMKPLELQYNIRRDELYYHNLKSIGQSGYVQEIDLIGVPKAPKEILEKYEEKKSAFTRNLNLEIQEALQSAENKKNGNKYSEMAYNHKQIAYAYHNTDKKLKNIAELCGVSISAVGQMLSTMDKRYPKWREGANIWLTEGDFEAFKQLKPAEQTQVREPLKN